MELLKESFLSLLSSQEFNFCCCRKPTWSDAACSHFPATKNMCPLHNLFSSKTNNAVQILEICRQSCFFHPQFLELIKRFFRLSIPKINKRVQLPNRLRDSATSPLFFGHVARPHVHARLIKRYGANRNVRISSLSWPDIPKG